MLSVKLDPDLEWLLEHYVDDLARYNILRYLHDNPGVLGDVMHFADKLGLRSVERVQEALDALVDCGLMRKEPCERGEGYYYGLSTDPTSRELVDRLYQLSSSNLYGEIVEKLAARSLHRARKARSVAHGCRRASMMPD